MLRFFETIKKQACQPTWVL